MGQTSGPKMLLTNHKLTTPGKTLKVLRQHHDCGRRLKSHKQPNLYKANKEKGQLCNYLLPNKIQVLYAECYKSFGRTVYVFSTVVQTHLTVLYSNLGLLATNAFITDNQKFGIAENLEFDPEDKCLLLQNNANYLPVINMV